MTAKNAFIAICAACFSISVLFFAESANNNEEIANQTRAVSGELNNGIRWINDETQQELFDFDDIVRFDWDKQIFGEDNY